MDARINNPYSREGEDQELLATVRFAAGFWKERLRFS